MPFLPHGHFPPHLLQKVRRGCPQWKYCLAAALRYGNIDSAVCLKRFIDWSHYRPENREIVLRTKTAVMHEYPPTGKSFEGGGVLPREHGRVPGVKKQVRIERFRVRL